MSTSPRSPAAAHFSSMAAKMSAKMHIARDGQSSPTTSKHVQSKSSSRHLTYTNNANPLLSVHAGGIPVDRRTSQMSKSPSNKAKTKSPRSPRRASNAGSDENVKLYDRESGQAIGAVVTTSTSKRSTRHSHSGGGRASSRSPKAGRGASSPKMGFSPPSHSPGLSPTA